MKNFKALTIFLLTFFYSVRPSLCTIDEDFIELTDIIDAFRKDPDVLQRQVTTDSNEQVNILKYYENSDVKNSDILYRLFHIINIVLSCEYSEITFKYIMLIDNSINECTNKIKSNKGDTLYHLVNFTVKYYVTYLQTVLPHIKSMILSLASLVKFTKNVVYKYHNILRTLLSWYAFLHQDSLPENITQDKLMSHLESISVTNFQIKNRLERFLVKHCYCLADFKRFQNGVNVADEKRIFKINKAKIVKLANPVIKSIENKSVINGYKHFKKLIKLLNDQVQDTIKVNWENKKIKIRKWFESIENSYDISTIILFEKTLIEVVRDVIVSHEIEELENTMNDRRLNINNEGKKKTNKCLELLNKVTIYANNITANRSFEQPIDLVKFLLKNKKVLSDLCSTIGSYEGDDKESIINNTISNLKNERKHVVSSLKDDAEFEKFLNSLSTLKISARLHPIVLHTFWEQSRVYDCPEVARYGIDYQSLHTMYNKSVNNEFCGRTLAPVDALNSLEDEMSKCLVNDVKTTCFSELNEKYDQLIVQIANITVNADERFVIDWEKILLTLIHNKENIELFDAKKQKDFNDKHIKLVLTFIHTMRSWISEIRFVNCSCGVLSSSEDIGKCPDPTSSNWNGLITKVDDIKHEKKMKSILEFEWRFKIITDRVQRMFESFRMTTMYWDGVEKSLELVHERYTQQTFDVQDALDYASYFIKWVIAIPYHELIQIFYEVRFLGFDSISAELPGITKSMDSFFEIKLLKHSAIEYSLPNFILLLGHTKAPNNEEKYKMMENDFNQLRNDFSFLNIVDQLQLTIMYQVWCRQFSLEINKLRDILDGM